MLRTVLNLVLCLLPLRSKRHSLGSLALLGLLGLFSQGALAIETPTNFTVPAEDTDGTFTITWSAVDGNVRYAVEHKRSTSSTWSRIHWGATTTKNIYNVTNGTHNYRLRACNVEGTECSDYTAVKSTVVQRPPLVPGGLSFTTDDNPFTPSSYEDKNGTFSFTWGAASGATRYVVHRKLNSGGWVQVHNSSSRTRSESGLANGLYTYRVQACTGSFACSGWSGNLSMDVQRPPGTPGGLTLPATSTTGNYSVSWNAVNGVTGYSLIYRKDGGAWDFAYIGPALSHSQSRTNGVYDYHVVACIDWSCSPESTTKTISVQSPPSVPGGLSFTTDDNPFSPSSYEDKDGSFSFIWGDTTGATRYVVHRKLNSGGWVQVHNSSSRTRMESALANGLYTYRVQACTGAFACSAWSSTITMNVQRPPATPSTLTVPATSSNGSFTASWSAVGGGADVYALTRRKAGEDWAIVYDGAATAFAMSGLAAGTYEFQARACIGWSCSDPTPIQTTVVQAAPPVPTGLNLPAQDNDGDFDVTWNASTGANKYTLQRRISGGSWLTIQDTSSRTHIESALESNHYDYRVRACMGAACSAWSVVQSVHVQWKPSTPTGFTLDPLSTTGTYTVGWNAVGGGVTHYVVTERTGGGAWTFAHVSLDRPYSVTDKPSGVYEYRIQACIDFSCSTPSNPKTISVERQATSLYFTSYPDYVVFDGSFDLTWKQLFIGSGVVSMSVTQQINNGAETTIATHSYNTTGISRPALDSGVYTYRYRVVSQSCSNGECDPLVERVVETISVTVDNIAEPVTVDAPTAVFDGTYTVSWDDTAPNFKIEEKEDGQSWAMATSWIVGSASRNFNRSPGKYVYRVSPCASAAQCFPVYSKDVLVSVVSSEPVTLTRTSASPVEAQGGVPVTAKMSLQVPFPTGADEIQLERRYNGATGWTSWVASSIDITGSSMVATSLIDLYNSNNYQFRARACVGSINSICQATYSDVVSFQLTRYAGASAPETSRGNFAVSVWGPPGNPNGNSLEIFELPPGGGVNDWVGIHEITNPAIGTGQEYTHDVSKSTAGTYSYRVKWCDKEHSPVVCTTGLPVSVTVKPLPGALPSASATYNSGSGAVTVVWSSASGVVEDYEVTVQPTGQTAYRAPGETNSDTATSRIINDLAPGTYTFKVRACNSLGGSKACNAGIVTNSITVPEPIVLGIPVVTAPATSEPGETYTVSWETVSGATSSAEYTLQERVNGAGGWINQVTRSAPPFFRDFNHAVGSYDYRVTVCEQSVCETSAIKTVQVEEPPPPPLVLDAVTGLTYTLPPDELGTVRFTLQWNSVEDADQYEVFNVTDSEISYSLGNVTTWDATKTAHPIGEYEFQVRACNSIESVCGPRSSILTIDLNESGWAQRSPVQVSDADYVAQTGPLHDDSVGSVKGQGGVSGGQASYQVPISLVPGRNGMMPSVTLGYSSRGGNSTVGMGWALSAGSSIARCPSTVAVDGVNGGVTLTNSDKLCLDGQRLIVTSGTYGSNGAVYRLELDTMTRVTQQGGDLSGTGAWFKAELKNGRVQEYGKTTESRQIPDGAGVTRAWSISGEQDRSGNSMAFHYVYGSEAGRSGATAGVGAGEHLLSEITYTGTNSTEGNRSVELTYETRSDVASQYLGGGVVRQTQRVARITTRLAGDAVREYNLTYTQSAATGRSLLNSVDECGFKGGSRVCKAPTTMQWLDAEADYVLEPVGYRNNPAQSSLEVADDPSFVRQYLTDSTGVTAPKFYDISKVIPHGDTNGDGVPDWPAIYQNEVKQSDGWFTDAEGVMRGTNSEELLTCNRGRGRAALRCIDADFNQDGKTDSWYITSSGVPKLNVRYAGGSWIQTGVELADVEDSVIAIADYNGDGWPDVLAEKYASMETTAGQSAKEIRLWLHQGASSLNSNPFTGNGILVRSIPKQINGTSYFVNEGVMPMGDMDGNGLPDLIITNFNLNIGAAPFYPLEQPIPESMVRTLISGTGQLSFSEVDLSDYQPNTAVSGAIGAYFTLFMDVNADGLADWLAWDTTGVAGGVAPNLHLALNIGGGEFGEWQNLGANSKLDILPIYTPGPPNEPIGPFVYYPKYAHGIKQFDYDSDGRPELLIPSGMVAETCASRRERHPDGSESSATRCGDQIFQPYPYYNGDVRSIEKLDGGLWDDNVYKYQLMRFVENVNGEFTAVLDTNIDADLIGSGIHAAVTDATGNGLSDLVFSFGCRRQGDIDGQAGGPDVCTIDSQTGPMADKDPGVYIVRNRGSVGAGGTERYQPVDMLAAVEDGFGVEDHWVYRPLSSQDERYSQNDGDAAADDDLRFYTPDFNYLDTQVSADVRNAHFHFGSSMYAVAEHRTSDGVGGLNTSQYRYKGAIYNREGRGFQGFRSVIHEDLSAALVSRSDFYQIFPLAGKLHNTRTWELGDITQDSEAGTIDPIKASSHTWRVTWNQENATPSSKLIDELAETGWPVAANAPYFVGPANETHTTRKLAKAGGSTRGVLYSTSVATSYENWGNAALKTTTYQEPGNNHRVESATTTTFATPDQTAWWLNRVDTVSTTRQAITNRLGLVAANDATTTTETAYVYNTTHRLPARLTVTDALGSAPGQVSAYTYTAHGLPATETVSLIGGGSPRVTTTTYSSDGYFPATVENAVGHETVLTYDGRFGVVTNTTDANDVNTGSVLDAFGRVVSQTSDLAPPLYTSLADCAVQSCVAHAVFVATQTQAGSPQRKTYVDQLGRELGTDVEGFSGAQVTTRIDYDNLGRVVFESVPSDDGVSNEGTHYLQYDVLGRLLQKRVDQFGADELETSYEHELGNRGFTTAITVDGDTHTLSMTRTYNGLNQLLETKDALNGTTAYAYDGRGNPIVIQDARSNKITAVYDAFSRKASVTDPDMGQKSFVYNGLGELVSETDARGITLSYTYDALGRMTERTSSGGSAPAYWTYDQATRSGGGLALGLLSKEQVGASPSEQISKVYSYDAKARVIGVTTNIRNALGTLVESFTTGMQYDAQYGRLKAMEYPEALTVAYGYNARGYKATVSNAASGFKYREITAASPRGQWEQGHLAGNKYTVTRAFDANTGWASNSLLQSATTDLHQETYVDYDDFGNLVIKNTGLRTTLGGAWTSEQETYQYDALHRLMQNTVGAVSSISYGYDGVGNFTLKDDYASSYSYPAGNNRLQSVQLVAGGLKTFGYDASGNLTTENGVNTIDYNAFNKPTEIRRPNVLGVTQSTAIDYGADLMRYRKVTKDGTETLYIDKLYERITDGATVKARYYIEDIAALTVTTDGGNTSSAIAYTHKDRLGSTVALVDHDGNPLEMHSYDPFGKPRQGSGAPKSVITLASEYMTRGFTDHEHMDEVQMIHMNGRGYDYNLGRFLSVDPFIVAPGNSQALNPYSYVLNNPLSGVDPTGYAKEKVEKNLVRVKRTGSRIEREVSVTRTTTQTENGTSTEVHLEGGLASDQQAVANGMTGALMAAGFNNVTSSSPSGEIGSQASRNNSGGMVDNYYDDLYEAPAMQGGGRKNSLHGNNIIESLTDPRVSLGAGVASSAMSVAAGEMGALADDKEAAVRRAASIVDDVHPGHMARVEEIRTASTRVGASGRALGFGGAALSGTAYFLHMSEGNSEAAILDATDFGVAWGSLVAHPAYSLFYLGVRVVQSGESLYPQNSLMREYFESRSPMD
ncbi:RHS repeat-associated core domain-containing protein [Parahaliea aestuarii]|uniref:Fibronectin type-III domain-containing protein n=1 Tax=Parahaliea aestuarii TaxID=1852021 RepID=A0A5C8ZNA3_9GAMM|nr:fibronectin type III domain-containing protein [Parahaliea aestuarii]TXS89037.1 hypothetical protein FVW59_19115 [Parahaliea aestuarii]